MLRELRIRNLAIIDDLSIKFADGLNVLTGETGAGKSIIIDALGLALGARAQADLIRAGEDEASVQVFIDLEKPVSVPGIEIDLSEGLLIRRALSSGGKSRAYVNDDMVTLQTLSAIGRAVVDILSQHEHQSLLQPEKQRSLLDSYGKLQKERQAVADLYAETGKVRQEYQALKAKVMERAHRLDLLRFQVSEIRAADPAPLENEKLEEEKKILSNLARLTSLTASAYSLIYEADGSCYEQLSAALSHMKEMTAIDPRTEEAEKAVESAIPLLKEAAMTLRDLRDRYELDPGRLEFLEERLATLRMLQKKYGDGIDAVIRYRENAEEEIIGLEASDDRLLGLADELAAKEKMLAKAAAELSEKRICTARKLEALIETALKDLAFGTPGFKIEVLPADSNGTAKISSHGADDIQFLFTANPGEPLRPLSKIISGGELSRVMLALKSILADIDMTPVLIFDEVDAGVGGSTAERVARKLKLLSEKHQVICITHLPQIASTGDVHLRIDKFASDGRTSVAVREISGKERTSEIARMLSGSLTDISLKHAGELLGKD